MLGTQKGPEYRELPTTCLHAHIGISRYECVCVYVYIQILINIQTCTPCNKRYGDQATDRR